LFLQNDKYNKIAEKYITVASKSASIFEVNTGAIARGLRTTVYPNENLLYILKKLDARLILSSDSHNIDTLDFGFAETKKYLKSIGFSHLYTLLNGEFIKYDI
jgi:histidinol-phosphatase (PHP family)